MSPLECFINGLSLDVSSIEIQSDNARSCGALPVGALRCADESGGESSEGLGVTATNKSLLCMVQVSPTAAASKRETRWKSMACKELTTPTRSKSPMRNPSLPLRTIAQEMGYLDLTKEAAAVPKCSDRHPADRVPLGLLDEAIKVCSKLAHQTRR